LVGFVMLTRLHTRYGGTAMEEGSVPERKF